MKIYTDNRDFADSFFKSRLNWKAVDKDRRGDSLSDLIKSVYPDKKYYEYEFDSADNPFHKPGENDSIWRYLFLVKHASQSHYDVLTDLCRQNVDLPSGILCLAGSGDKFHGFKSRPWASIKGNIHLVAYLAPNQQIENYGIGFTVLSAVSAVQAIDSLGELNGRAGLKWVNDVLIDGAKVCGVLAYSQSEGDIITGAVLGLGMNVETKPEVEPNIYVPKVASLKDFGEFSDEISLQAVFYRLVEKISANYSLLCQSRFKEILDFYRKRSVIIGKKVEIFPDTEEDKTGEIISGIVERIGDNLELYVEGNKGSINKGRLAIFD